MASQSYMLRAIVLKKTKLGESDLIFTLLGQDGSQVKAVAKGARKPTSPFSSRMELYSVVDALISKGRNLDIVTEVRLVESGDLLRSDIAYSTAAAPMAELLSKVTQSELVAPKLFDMTQVALATLNKVEEDKIPAITAGHLLKANALLGLRPSLDTCVYCGNKVDLASRDSIRGFSYEQGGVVCGLCGSTGASKTVSVEMMKWIAALLSLTFEEIKSTDIDVSRSFELLHFCQTWIHQHSGVRLKSLDFMFTSGIYA